MPHESPRRIQDLFAAALEMPESERDRFLVSACGEDVAVLDELRGLLEMDLSLENKTLRHMTARRHAADGISGHLCRLQIIIGAAMFNLFRFQQAEATLNEASKVCAEATDATPSSRRRCIATMVELYAAWQSKQPEPDRQSTLNAWKLRLAAAESH